MIRAVFVAILAAVSVAFCTDVKAAVLNWDRPSADRYTGTIEAALKRYESKTPGDGLIPADDLFFIKLAVKQKHGWTDVVVIRRDEIDGRENYLPQIQHMHSGADKVHAVVNRSGWAPDHIERGIVYCAAGPLCVLVPSVCGNVSIITRIPQQPRIVEFPDAGGGSPPVDGFALILQLPPPDPVVPPSEPAGNGLRVAAVPPVLGESAPEPRTFASGSGAAVFPPVYYPPTGGGSIVVLQVPAAPIPEPGTWALMLAGLAFVWRMYARNN